MKSSKKKLRDRWVAVSGSFDPLHIGHVHLFRAAKKLGDKLLVIVHNDNVLRLKRGFVLTPQKERAKLIEAFNFVDRVVVTRHFKNDPNRGISSRLRTYKPTLYVRGGSRESRNLQEDALCDELGIMRKFGVGRDRKLQPSTAIIREALRSSARTVRPWGEFSAWDMGKEWYLKTIRVRPGKRLSLQYHHFRSEYWLLVEGDVTATLRNSAGADEQHTLNKGQLFFVPKGAVHRMQSAHGGIVVEVASGHFDENDIVRIEDDHGRI